MDEALERLDLPLLVVIHPSHHPPKVPQVAPILAEAFVYPHWVSAITSVAVVTSPV
jgi:hypothetical protein